MLEYTDHDTDRAREAEFSSAGQPTQNLSAALPPTPTVPPLHAQRRQNNTLALVLIGLGVAALLARLIAFPVELGAGMILLTIASCFLFFAFWRRIYGLVIPGCVLAGLSIGVTFADLTDGVSVLWGLALGFLCILLAGQRVFGIKNTWPAIPAVILFAVGIIVAIANLPTLFAGVLVWLPLLLIGAGLYLGATRQHA